MHVNPHSLQAPGQVRVELQTEISELQVSSAQKVKQLKTAKLQVTMDKMGHSIDKQMHSNIVQITEKHKSNVEITYPPESFHCIFRDQQLKAASYADFRGIHWHPLMIKWALHLQHQPSGAYKTLRSSGCIALPSQRILRDMMSATIWWVHPRLLNQKIGKDMSSLYWMKCISVRILYMTSIQVRWSDSLTLAT